MGTANIERSSQRQASMDLYGGRAGASKNPWRSMEFGSIAIEQRGKIAWFSANVLGKKDFGMERVSRESIKRGHLSQRLLQLRR